MPGGIFLIHVAVHGQPEALGACSGEHRLELDRRIALLVGVQSYADDPVLVRQRLLQRPHRGFDAHVSQETHDELRADSELVQRILLRSTNSADDGVEGDASRGVRLRVEEDLGIDHVLVTGPGQVGGRQIVEVRFGQQDAHALVVDLQKGRQIVEIVRGTHFLDGSVRQLDAVAPSETELQLRLEGSLHMDVELGLRHAFDESSHVGHDFKTPPCRRNRVSEPIGKTAVGAELKDVDGSRSAGSGSVSAQRGTVARDSAYLYIIVRSRSPPAERAVSSGRRQPVRDPSCSSSSTVKTRGCGPGWDHVRFVHRVRRSWTICLTMSANAVLRFSGVALSTKTYEPSGSSVALEQFLSSFASAVPTSS